MLPPPKMSINGASTVFGLASCILTALCNGINPWSMYWPPLLAKCWWQWCCHLLKISLNRASTILCLASWKIQGLWNSVTPQSTKWLPSSAKMLVTISRLPPTIEHQWSVNICCSCSVSYTALKCIGLFLNWVLHSQSFQYDLVYNFTNMHSMSHRSNYFCS